MNTVFQTLRGFLAGVMIAYNFEYVAKFSVGNESKILIPLLGKPDNLFILRKYVARSQAKGTANCQNI